ncbi:MAG: LicD family protein [Kineothrix sp.]|nr:LicD family protein [Kineothrix sp.]
MAERAEGMMKQRVSFPNEFFQDEVREGFLVERKMKCAWAAQIEVLKEIERICNKYGLRYFADSGTLLGAVRHKGFIPWDDDLDIAMLRDDYRKFMEVAPAELPEGWKLLDLKGGFEELFIRVTNGDTYDSRAERLLQFHGCPYVVGIDIFPIEYVPPKADEEEIWYLISIYLFHLMKNVSIFGGKNILGNIEQDLRNIEEMCKTKIDRNGNLERQLKELLDRMIQTYPGEGAKELELIIFDLKYEQLRYKYKREWYEESLIVPFENTTIPIPAGYADVLKIVYGKEYMKPVQYAPHDYPFYKKQDIELEKMRREQGASENDRDAGG